MQHLEQSDVDALLASASDLADEAGSAPGDADAPQEQDPQPVLPPQFRLTTTNKELERLLPIKITVRVRLAERRMRVKQLLELTVGTIIEFDRSADSDLDLVASNVCIGTGNAVKCGENFGLRVIGIQPLAQKLLGMGLIR